MGDPAIVEMEEMVDHEVHLSAPDPTSADRHHCLTA